MDYYFFSQKALEVFWTLREVSVLETSNQNREGQTPSCAESQPSIPALPHWHSVAVQTPGLCYRVFLSPHTLHGLPSPVPLSPPLPLLSWSHPAPSTFHLLQFYQLGPQLPHLHPHLSHMPCSAPSAWRLRSFEKQGGEARKKSKVLLWKHFVPLLEAPDCPSRCVCQSRLCGRLQQNCTQRSMRFESSSHYVSLSVYTYKVHAYADAHARLQLSLQGLVAGDTTLLPCSHRFIFCSPVSFAWPSGWEEIVTSQREKDFSPPEAARIFEDVSRRSPVCWMDSWGWTHKVFQASLLITFRIHHMWFGGLWYCHPYLPSLAEKRNNNFAIFKYPE